MLENDGSWNTKAVAVDHIFVNKTSNGDSVRDVLNENPTIRELILSMETAIDDLENKISNVLKKELRESSKTLLAR